MVTETRGDDVIDHLALAYNDAFSCNRIYIRGIYTLYTEIVLRPLFILNSECILAEAQILEICLAEHAG